MHKMSLCHSSISSVRHNVNVGYANAGRRRLKVNPAAIDCYVCI